TLDLSEQMPLAIDIAQNGGVISEYSPEEISRPDNLSNTNRLLSGLSHAVVFTELYSDSNQTLDLLSFCHDIGKLAFLMVDPQYGALSDETTLATASRQGLITIVGFDKIDNIIKALV
ncbi:MAG: DNA-processing protein DprA, partial [candidate division Zixibacteria bacterium]|nr:DNA-processing protein DprA [candidate division Zixibacteria bacterium]